MKAQYARRIRRGIATARIMPLATTSDDVELQDEIAQEAYDRTMERRWRRWVAAMTADPKSTNSREADR